MANLANLRLVAPEEDDDDLYGGYDYDPTLDVDTLGQDEGFQQAVKTSYGQRPPMPFAGKPPGTGRKPAGSYVPGTASGRLKTGARPPPTGVPMLQLDPGQARPMTSVRAAGFTSHGKRSTQGYEASGQTSGATLETKPDDTPEELMKALEKKVNDLVEESTAELALGNKQMALEKGKEAARKERHLSRQREQNNLGDINLDLTYWVLFNLASVYHANEMYTEALNTYLIIIKNKTYATAGRLRINMGNIYCEQNNLPQAIKMYRMALDKFPTTHKMLRMKIMENIAAVFVKMGQYAEAINHYEVIMSEKASFKTALNLVLCYVALGHRDKMKQTFVQMLKIPLRVGDDDRYYPQQDDQHSVMLHDAIKDDSLRQYEDQRKKVAEQSIVTAAKVIAPTIENSFAAGFDWCVECVRTSPYANLVSDLEITKAVTYLKIKEHRRAIETLKDFEKKDTKLATAAATNLSFMFLLDNDVDQADKYADLAIQSDRYNPAALVNKGNCDFVTGEYEKAKQQYQEALSIEASCVEALFNMGLVNKKLDLLEEALDCFMKLHTILPAHSQVMYQLADIYELLGDVGQAIEWFVQLLNIVPSDPAALARLGKLYDKEQNDKSTAFQFYQDAHRYYPCDIEVISWLGGYYVDSQFCEKAIPYFEHAAILQPGEIKWQLMVASCHRRTGNYQEALEHYKRIHLKFPENTDCLKFLIRLCTDLGLPDVQEYATKLRKAEKVKEAKENKSGSSSAGRRRRDRDSSRERGDSSHRNSRHDSGRRDSEAAPEEFTTAQDDWTVQQPASKEIDATYTDPLGDLPVRPKTAARHRVADEDEFADEELGDDLLPE